MLIFVTHQCLNVVILPQAEGTAYMCICCAVGTHPELFLVIIPEVLGLLEPEPDHLGSTVVLAMVQADQL